MKTPLTASSMTDCKEQPLLFQDLGSRQVVADFSGGTLSSDGGALLLRQVDVHLGLTQNLAHCFTDARQQVYVDHSVRQLLAQRLYGLALGYEDLNDHQRLRLDPLLAGVSTLNRLELSSNRHTRCHKLPHDPGKIQAVLRRPGVRCLPRRAAEVVLDLDAM